MKQILITLLTLVLSIKALTAPINILLQTYGNWNSPAAWSLQRVPSNNDTLIIPAGFILNISSNISLNNLYVIVSGKIKLLNGKLDLDKFSDVYVMIGGSIIGNSNNDKIRIGNAEVFRGSEPAVIGPAFADITTGSGFQSFALLPVKFVSFTAKRSSNAVELKWITSEEINNSHFEIQFSNDGLSWKTAGIVNANLNPSAVNKYSFTHTTSTGNTVYYRIKQVDKSEHVSYSTIQTIHSIVSETNAEVFTVSKQVIAVNVNGVVKPATVKVYNQSGKLITQTVENSNQVRLNISSGTTEIYVVQVIVEGKLIVAKKLML